MTAIVKDVLKKTNPEELVSLVKNEGLFFVVMNKGDNRINSSFCAAFNRALDGIEADTELKAKTAVVTVSTHERIFSNGMDIGNFSS